MALQPNLLNFISDIQIDKILKVASGTFNVAAPTGGLGSITVDGFATFDTGINDTTFFYGVFSLDGGATWNDFNSSVVEITGGNPVFQTCDVWGESRAGTFYVWARNWYNFVNSTGTARTVMYKVALVAKRDQAVVPTASTDEKLQFITDYNYPKIAVDDVQTMSLATNERKAFVIPHNLGYVPKVLGFATFLNGTQDNYLYDFGHMFSGDAYSAMLIDTSNFTYIISNENNPNPASYRVHTRIYYDA